MHELRAYLEMLLAHECRVSREDCGDCRRLQRIYRFIQTELFATVVYEETPLAPRRHGARPASVTRAAASPPRPEAH
jgi:hypothetical protein